MTLSLIGLVIVHAVLGFSALSPVLPLILLGMLRA